jgi:hypothetical protein
MDSVSVLVLNVFKKRKKKEKKFKSGELTKPQSFAVVPFVLSSDK